MSATLWLCRLRLTSASRPGTLARIAHVFAERGISIAEMLAADEFGVPMIALTFASSPRLRDYLARRLGRMPDVVAVAMSDAEGRGIREATKREPRTGGW